MDRHDEQEPPLLHRRSAIATMAGGVCLAMLPDTAAAGQAAVTTAPPPPGAATKASFTKEIEADGMMDAPGLHQGKGTVGLRYFAFSGASAPAHLLLYDLPPGASEGVHTHFLDDHNKEGAFDEYYYIVSGHGQMEIDGEIVAVTQGDHVHTPLGVAHGIENIDATDHLRVFLTVVERKA